jgi:hypothetical protein
VLIYDKYEATKSDMMFTKEDEITHANSTHCHICELIIKKFQSLKLVCYAWATIAQKQQISGDFI